VNILKKTLMGLGLVAVASSAQTILDTFNDNQLDVALPGVVTPGFLFLTADPYGTTFTPDTAALTVHAGTSLSVSITRVADNAALNRYSYGLLGLNFADPKAAISIASFTGISVTYSSATGVNLVLDDGREDGAEYFCALAASAIQTTRTCNFVGGFAQPTWATGTLVRAIPTAALFGIQFKAPAAGVTSFTLYNVTMLGGSVIPPVSSSSAIIIPPSSSSATIPSTGALDTFNDNQLDLAVGGAVTAGFYFTTVDAYGSTITPDSASLALHAMAPLTVTMNRVPDNAALNQYSYALLGVNFADPKGAVNISTYPGIGVTYSSTSGMNLVLDDGAEDGAEYFCTLPPTVGQSTKFCSFATDFVQPAWAATNVPPLTRPIPLTALYGIQFKAASAGIKDISLYSLALDGVPVSLSPRTMQNSELNFALNNGLLNYSAPSVGAVSLQVFDVTGQQVKSFEGLTQTGSVNLGLNQSGVYLIRMTQNGQSLTRKVNLK
jgi:hypothetical protein